MFQKFFCVGKILWRRFGGSTFSRLIFCLTVPKKSVIREHSGIGNFHPTERGCNNDLSNLFFHMTEKRPTGTLLCFREFLIRQNV